MSAIIRLKSSDGEIFETDVEVAKTSGMIKTMLEDCGIDEGSDTVIPLHNVRASVLRKVLEWANHHKNDVPAPRDDDENKADNISAWDEEFLKVDHGSLFELITAANFLDIKLLLDVACKTVANMMKGKDPEGIRKLFNIENDLSPSEQAQIRMENEWCEETK